MIEIREAVLSFDVNATSLSLELPESAEVVPALGKLTAVSSCIFQV